MVKKRYKPQRYSERGLRWQDEPGDERWRHTWNTIPGDQSVSDHFRERPTEAVAFALVKSKS